MCENEAGVSTIGLMKIREMSIAVFFGAKRRWQFQCKHTG